MVSLFNQIQLTFSERGIGKVCHTHCAFVDRDTLCFVSSASNVQYIQYLICYLWDFPLSSLYIVRFYDENRDSFKRYKKVFITDMRDIEYPLVAFYLLF